MMIYKITNLVNGKAYIGKTTSDSPSGRWKKHKTGGRTPIQVAIQEYGQYNFQFEVLLDYIQDVETLNMHEERLIKKYGTRIPDGYNIRLGGEGGDYNSVHWSQTDRSKLLRTRARGEHNKMSKLTWKQVRIIRFLYKVKWWAGTRWTQERLADRFGVNQTTVGHVVAAKNWK